MVNSIANLPQDVLMSARIAAYPVFAKGSISSVQMGAAAHEVKKERSVQVAEPAPAIVATAVDTPLDDVRTDPERSPAPEVVVSAETNQAMSADQMPGASEPAQLEFMRDLLAKLGDTAPPTLASWIKEMEAKVKASELQRELQAKQFASTALGGMGFGMDATDNPPVLGGVALAAGDAGKLAAVADVSAGKEADAPQVSYEIKPGMGMDMWGDRFKTGIDAEIGKAHMVAHVTNAPTIEIKEAGTDDIRTAPAVGGAAGVELQKIRAARAADAMQLGIS